VNLVIDPFVAQKAKANVTLQLEDATLETTVRLLAELAEVKSVRLGNVLFITTEEKAKKIRKEEPNQIDPLNPNGPMPFRGVIGGAVGAFGGVMPMPARIFPPAQPPQGLPPGLVPPPPGIEVQPDRPAPDAPPKKGSTSPAVPQRPQPPQAPPGVERSTDPAIPLPPQKN
ncbi:MAG: hypothetical protein HY289_03820, partial [Planctomycetes bacterium]|nr:hypothetical protein [Planctomycetota bacterium]